MNGWNEWNNYRPIPTATALLKVLEHVLLSRLASAIVWTVDCRQPIFTFKQAQGTEIAIFALMQIVDFFQ